MSSAEVTAFSATAYQLIGAAITPTVNQFTIVRIRGQLVFWLNTASAIREGYQLRAGIGVATLDAFTAGAASVPNPFSDQEWPGWMWQGSLDLRTAIGALAVGDPSVNPMVLEIDVKAMRILRQNEVVFMGVEATESGAATMDVRGTTRMLIKLA